VREPNKCHKQTPRPYGFATQRGVPAGGKNDNFHKIKLGTIFLSRLPEENKFSQRNACETRQYNT
jgi:hypothetical protein